MFPGGCFFAVTSAELGSRRGAVHDRVADYQRQWTELLRQTAQEAAAKGELAAGEDPDELGAVLAGSNIVAVLHSDDTVLERAPGHPPAAGRALAREFPRAPGVSSVPSGRLRE